MSSAAAARMWWPLMAVGRVGPRYPPIADHGLIGDLHTVALVGMDGTSTDTAARGSTP